MSTSEDRFPRYVSAQLHCHSSIEGPASIGAHCYEARRAGVEVVWLTDHDTRIALTIGGPFVDRFDFEYPELTTSVARAAPGGRTVQRSVGWGIRRRDAGLAVGRAEPSRERCYAGTQSLLLEAGAGTPEATEAAEGAGAAQGAGGAEATGAAEGAGAPEAWQYLVAEFKADAKLHSRPLLAEPVVGLAVWLDWAGEGGTGNGGGGGGGGGAGSGDAEAWLDLVLSEQAPDLRQSRLRYLLTAARGGAGHAPEGEDRYNTRVVPMGMPVGEWRRHEIVPGADADPDLGGVDNALVALRLGLRVRRGARLRLFVDDLTIAHRYAGGALHARQRELARRLGERYGVTCHVAQEISLAGQHKNAWGATVPVLDYAAQPGGFSHEEGIAWARRHGGVFSLNHPFSPYGRLELDGAGQARVLEELVTAYAGNGASGADTLEVGFPAGRHGFPLESYLQLWDGLSRRGVIITGSASSDAHSARVGWQTGNNFATRIRAGATDEEALLAGLRAGDVYAADPVLFRGRLRFGDRAGHRMGQVVAVEEAGGRVVAGTGEGEEADGAGGAQGTAGREVEVELALDQARPSWELRWVVDGERRAPVPLREGPATETLTVALPRRGGTFVRAEVWDVSRTPAGEPATPAEGAPPEEGAAATGGAASGTGGAASAERGAGRCIALTNPIWYLPAGEAAGVPAARRAPAAP